MTFCDVNWCFGEMQVTEKIGGPERDRTAGLLVANEALSQLSYSPTGDFFILTAEWDLAKASGSARGCEFCSQRSADGCAASHRKAWSPGGF